MRWDCFRLERRRKEAKPRRAEPDTITSLALQQILGATNPDYLLEAYAPHVWGNNENLLEGFLERDKTSLDSFRIKNKSLADLDNLPSPDELADDIIKNLQSTPESFQELQKQLKK